MNIIKVFLLIACFTTWTLGIKSSDQSDSQETITSVSIDPDDSLFNLDLYQDIDYARFVKAQESLVNYKHIVKEIHLENEYPELNPSNCGEKKCRTMMYEITNHNMHENHKKKIPTILLLGGMSGQATLGIQTLLELVRVIQKVYTVNNQWFHLVNTVRILVIPAANMNGFYHQSTEEVYEQNGNTVRIDPKFDFNLRPKKHCFSTFASQVVSRVFNDYLIYGTVLLSDGDFDVKWPKLHDLLGIAEQLGDQSFYEELVDNIINMMNYHMDFMLEYSEKSSEPASDTIGQGMFGSYIEWASGASYAEKYLNHTCFDKNNHFEKSYQPPNDVSHRAVAIEISINKAQVKGSLDEALGNEVFIANPFSEEADSGLIPALAITIQRFIEIMQPYVSLKKISLGKISKEPESSFNLDLELDIFGVIFCDLMKIESPEAQSQASDVLIHEWFTSQSNLISIKSKISGDSGIDDATSFDININLDCERQTRENLSGTANVVSHYLQGRITPNYSVVYADSILTPFFLTNYQIKGVRKGQFSEGLIMETQASHSKIVYFKHLLVQVGEYFPIKVNYDSNLSQVDFDVIDKNIPQNEDMLGFPDYILDSGIVNHVVHSKYNERLFDLLKNLHSGVSGLKMLIFNDNTSYICSQIKTDLLIEKKNELTNKIKIQKKILDSESGNLSEEEVENVRKELEFLQKEYQANQCNQFWDESQAVGKNSYFMVLNNKKSTKILPSAFYRLLGRSVHVSFKVPIEDSKSVAHPDQPESNREPPNSVEKPMRISSIELNGKIVIEDPAITGISTGDKNQRFPEPGAVIKMTSSKLLEVKHTSLSCSSMIPFQKISSQNLKMIADHKFHEKKRPNKFFDLNSQNFFLIQVKTKGGFDGKGVINLYTNLTSPGFVLYNKKKPLKLKKTQKMVQIRGIYSSQDIQIYQGLFPSSDLSFLGLYMLVYEEKGKMPVFECFMGKDKGDFDVKTEYIVYQNILDEIESNYNLLKTNGKSWFKSKIQDNLHVIFWILFGIILTVGIAFLILKYHFGYLKRESKEDLSDALDLEEGQPESSKEKPKLTN